MDEIGTYMLDHLTMVSPRAMDARAITRAKQRLQDMSIANNFFILKYVSMSAHFY